MDDNRMYRTSLDEEDLMSLFANELARRKGLSNGTAVAVCFRAQMEGQNLVGVTVWCSEGMTGSELKKYLEEE